MEYIGFVICAFVGFILGIFVEHRTHKTIGTLIVDRTDKDERTYIWSSMTRIGSKLLQTILIRLFESGLKTNRKSHNAYYGEIHYIS